MYMKKITNQDPESKSPDIVAENIEHLKVIFPEAFTEGKIDFEVFKQLLGGKVDEKEEKYGLNWHGKRNARLLALTPSTGTLRPCPEESIDWDTTQNLMIEGDNLEVLKLLQKSYARKVKLIYIDPPYNTGGDFVYPDDFQDNIKNYLMRTGQVESDGRKNTSNTEASGRWHTDWLNMIYPRLKLARNLLRDDGVIYISIDDGEVDNLKKVCNEIFGEENLIAVMPWKGRGGRQASEYLAGIHEFVLFYAKNASEFVVGEQIKEDEVFPKYDPVKKRKYKITLLRKWGNAARRQDRPNMYYAIPAPDGTEAYPKLPDGSDGRWRWERSNALKALENGDLEFIQDSGNWIVYEKTYEPKEGEVRTKKYTTWLDDVGTTANGTDKLKELFETPPFNFPKPPSLIERLIQIAGKLGNAEDFIVMDFFAGSGTTGHAVMTQNIADDDNRRYILVQLPELLDPDNRDQKVAADFCDSLGKPRNITGDVGFRVFKLDSSNIQAWEPDRDNLAATLEEHAEHLKSDRTEQDILFELLLKLGLDLTVPIEEKPIAGKTVFSIGAGTLLVCLATEVSEAEVEPLALGIVEWHTQLAPAGETQVVFRDSAFANDVAKTNLTAILEQHGLENVRSI